jgi:hypothetical protein
LIADGKFLMQDWDMALLLPYSIFFHIPKTGGTWVRAAIKNAGIPADEICRAFGDAPVEPVKLFHARPDDISRQGPCTFAFVRHPVTYYQSYWAHKMRIGKEHYNGFDEKYMRDDFEAFVRAVLPDGPWVTKLFVCYVGHYGDVLDYVGKQERLADDLVHVLRLAGEDFDEDKLRMTPRVNEASITEELRARCVCTPTLHAEICDRERWVLERFGYPDNPSDL